MHKVSTAPSKRLLKKLENSQAVLDAIVKTGRASEAATEIGVSLYTINTRVSMFRRMIYEVNSECADMFWKTSNGGRIAMIADNHLGAFDMISNAIKDMKADTLKNLEEIGDQKAREYYISLGESIKKRELRIEELKKRQLEVIAELKNYPINDNWVDLPKYI